MKKFKENLTAQVVLTQYHNAIEAGISYSFADIYSHLPYASGDNDMINMIAEETEKYLFQNTPDSINLYNYEIWTDTNPSKWSFSPDYRALLRAGTLIPNGYFREKCLRLLNDAKNRDPGDLRYIILRVNDNVPKIRRIAADALKEHIAADSPYQLMQASPEFERLCGQCRWRRDDLPESVIYTDLIKRFAESPDDLKYCPQNVRRACYNIIFFENISDKNAVRSLAEHFIQTEKTGTLRDIIVKKYLRDYGDEIPEERIKALFTDKYFKIRYIAYMLYLKRFGMWDGFEKLLLEKYASIREFAAFYLKKSGFDCAAYCRANIPESILALGENGDKSDIELIRKYLNLYPCECLTALTKLGSDDHEELLWEYLCHGDKKVSKTACKLIYSHRIYYPTEYILEYINKTEQPELKWRMIKLLNKRGDWSILPVLMRLTREYTHLQTDIINSINTVVMKHSNYAKSLSPELAEEIGREFLYAEKHLPKLTADIILYETGRAGDPRFKINK